MFMDLPSVETNNMQTLKIITEKIKLKRVKSVSGLNHGEELCQAPTLPSPNFPH